MAEVAEVAGVAEEVAKNRPLFSSSGERHYSSFLLFFDHNVPKFFWQLKVCLDR